MVAVAHLCPDIEQNVELSLDLDNRTKHSGFVLRCRVCFANEAILCGV